MAAANGGGASAELKGGVGSDSGPALQAGPPPKPEEPREESADAAAERR